MGKQHHSEFWGLTTFINREKRFYENYRLHSTRLVIDGCGLSPAIYFDRELNIDPGNHGGEHQTYYIHCTRFFRNMISCGVECYVIFDGGCDKDGLKFETLKERAQQSIDHMKELNETGDRYITIAENYMDVFITALDDLDIQYFSCDFEADRDIAILANEFKCPVLGQDSDFFIMNIHEGYIPLDSLNWKKLCSYSRESAGDPSCPPHSSNPQANQNFLQCVKFRLAEFCRYFQVMPSMMPVFASLCGNDYTKRLNLEELRDSINHHHRKPDRRPHPHRKGHRRFCDLLYNLTFFTTVEECMEEALKFVHVDERSKLQALLKESCSMYDVASHSDVVQFFRNENSQLDEISTNDTQSDSESGDEDEEEEGTSMPAICESLLRQRTVFLCVQKEKLSEPRATACCDGLLKLLAGMMLKKEVAGEETDEKRKLTFDVYHRECYTLTCTKMEPMWVAAGYGKVPYYKEIPRLPKSSRRSLLLAALNVRNISFNNIPDSFHLTLLASIYCCKNANPPISKYLLHALVLSWCQGVAWFQDNAHKLQKDGRQRTEFDISWDVLEVETVLQNYGALVAKSLGKSVDFEVSHAFMQWLSCNSFTTDLNILLQNVLPDLDVRIWYNGILIHNLYRRLKEIRPCKHQNWIKNGLMLDAPTAYAFYQDIMLFFDQNLTFQTNSKEESGPLPLKRTTGEHHKATQTESQVQSGTPSKGPKEAGNSDTSRGSSKRKKHKGSRKSRGNKTK